MGSHYRLVIFNSQPQTTQTLPDAALRRLDSKMCHDNLSRLGCFRLLGCDLSFCAGVSIYAVEL
jgi:hypothetical protein